MRVGIVTQPLEMNYGGILQNWALQQVLRNLGYDPITIDAYERYSTSHYLFNCIQVLLSRLKGNKKGFPKRYYGSLRKPMTGDFVEKHIAKTHVMWDYQRSVVRRYKLDAIVVGSDQVWRAKYNGKHIEDMYLRFTKGLSLRRIAYAASFGVDEWEYTPEQTIACAGLAKQMDAISVREISGIELCNKYLGVEACCVLDPTLLIDASDYEALIVDEVDSMDVGPYLAVYCLDITPEKKVFFEELAKERGLAVRYFSAGWYAEITVKQWLMMFRHATMVVTDSFHGMVFSILFKKEFYALCNQDRGNTRITNLLRIFGLDDRIASDVESVMVSKRVINWQAVYALLEEERRRSLDFLVGSLR